MLALAFSALTFFVGLMVGICATVALCSTRMEDDDE